MPWAEGRDTLLFFQPFNWPHSNFPVGLLGWNFWTDTSRIKWMVFPDFHFKAGVTIPVPFYRLKTVACAQLFLALLKRKEAEYWKALCLHHCVSSTHLLDLFPLSCNLAFALSLHSHCLVHAWCIVYAHTHWIQGWNNHRAQSIRMFIWCFQVCGGDFLLLWVRHLYWQHFIFKETVIKIKRLNKLIK